MAAKDESASPSAVGPVGSAFPPVPHAPRELIVRVLPRTEAKIRGVSVVGKELTGLGKLLADEGATMQPLFGPTERSVRLRVEKVPGAPALELYYRVFAEDKRLDGLAEKLRAIPGIEAAYVKPGCVPASLTSFVLPRPEDPPPVTPDFIESQGYLDAAPSGVNARYAWKRPGGRGSGVEIIDVEGAWRFTHETLIENQGGLIAGDESTSLYWRNHGTAVLGVFGGDGVGITGIASEAFVRTVSILGIGSAPAVATAADALGVGDVLLFELHRPGPRYGHIARPDFKGYIPPEWWPDDFAAVQYATASGVIVVEVGGNGSEDLDDPIYDQPEPGFPPDWENPFRRNQDSGAILVGAGAPPPGTHGANHGPDRSRVGYSNYGSCFDVQGWGFEITTSGYGELQGGEDEDRWYTDKFTGTSGASAIVTGVLASLQGALDAHEKERLTPATARHLLRTTGSPQEDAPTRPATQRIGNRPNLRQAFERLRISGIKPGPPVDLTADPVRVDDPTP